MSYLKKIQNKSRYTQAIKSHYETVALDVSVSKELALKLGKLEPGKQQQDFLEKFVMDEGISGDDLLALMYDLNKEGFSALKKPTVQGTPKPKAQHSNPMIAKIENGEIDKDLGKMLRDAEGSNTKEYKEVVEFFNKNQKAYGKFMELAEKNGINFYEKNFGDDIIITKEAFAQVSNNYLLDSILYSSVYSGLSAITDDALEYAFNRFKNPIKDVIDRGYSPDMFSLVVKNKSGWKQKLKTWFKDLSPSEQKDIEDYYWDEKHDGPIADYK